MHIIVVSNVFPPDVFGGYELLAADLVKRLRASGHKVSVLTSGAGAEDNDTHRVLRLARPFGSDPKRDRLRHLAAALWNRRMTQRFLDRIERPEVVLGMSFRRLGLEPLRVLQARGLPVVYTVNDDWPVAFVPTQPAGLRGLATGLLDRGPWARHTFHGVDVDRVVYLSDSVRAEVQRVAPWFPKGRVQAQGVDLKTFVSRPFRPFGEPWRLLFVGRLHPSKAPDMALRTLAELRSRGIEATLTMAGAPVSDAYARELHELERELGVEGHVDWRGLVPREELPDVYRAADVMLFLNRWAEPQGLTYMEAMACGVPVVAYPLGGAKELLDAHPVAALASAFEPPVLADAVCALERDVQTTEELTARAKELVRDVASLEAYVRVLETEMCDALNGSLPR